MRTPFVSFIIPTLNAQRHFEKCLASIRKQTYPQNGYEVLVVDGGSTDQTLTIAKKYRAKVINNLKKDPETAKSLGIAAAKGEIVALLDTDNEIVKKDWLLKMTQPLTKNRNLFGVESFYFSRKNDNLFNRYCMAIHIADPFSRRLASQLKMVKKKDYWEYEIPRGGAYPLGANGFLWRRSVIEKVAHWQPMFEESNFSFFAMEAGHRKFARVHGYGIYHYHLDSFWDFVGKRLKIGGKFLNRKEEKKRTWLEGVSKAKFLTALIYCSTLIGPLVEGTYHFSKTAKSEWLLHPLMSFVSVASYGYTFVIRKLKL